MINSRDSANDWYPKKKEIIEVPYKIGEVVELKNNPSLLARINQYRITVENYSQIINVGLSFNIYGKQSDVDLEITSEELKEKWKKTDKMILKKLDSETYQISEMSEDYKNIKKSLKKRQR